MDIIPYLTFSGNCREAMKFYKDCIGGSLSFDTVGESPMADYVPANMNKYILNARLIKDNFKLYAADILSLPDITNRNNISILLNCSSENELNEVYNLLSQGGNAARPVKVTNWGSLSGDLIDKYGNQWMLNYQP